MRTNQKSTKAFAEFNDYLLALNDRIGFFVNIAVFPVKISIRQGKTVKFSE
jgi:hypothetical protein